MEHLNNASSQTENYEIIRFHSRVTKASYHSNLFLLFVDVQNEQQLILFGGPLGKGSQILSKLSRRLRRFYLVIRMFGANDFQ